MSDIGRTVYENQLARKLVEEATRNGGKDARALTPVEANVLARYAMNYRHIAAHFDAKIRKIHPPPYVVEEIELRADGPCPVCGQNVHVAIEPASEPEIVTRARRVLELGPEWKLPPAAPDQETR